MRSRLASVVIHGVTGLFWIFIGVTVCAQKAPQRPAPRELQEVGAKLDLRSINADAEVLEQVRTLEASNAAAFAHARAVLFTLDGRAGVAHGKAGGSMMVWTAAARPDKWLGVIALTSEDRKRTDVYVASLDYSDRARIRVRDLVNVSLGGGRASTRESLHN